MSAYKLLIIGLGGFLGSVARYVTAKFVDEKLNPVFPYGTLTVNVVGSFLLGMIYMHGPSESRANRKREAIFGRRLLRGLYHVFRLCPGKF